MSMKQSLATLFFLVISLCYVLAFQSNQPLDREAWNELKKDIDYSRVDKNSSQQTETGNGDGGTKREPRAPARSQSSASDSEPIYINLGPIAQIIIIGLFIALIVWLLYLLIGNEVMGRGSTRVKGDNQDIIMTGDEIPHESDLEKWLKQALKQNNYKLVVRIYFLMIIKELENKKLIRWENEKTNRDYLHELDGSQYQSDFMAVAMNYDRVWYGDKPYPEEALRSISHDFKIFRDTLSKAPK